MPSPKRSKASPITPVLLWMDLAWKSGEMLLTSAQVINHRTTMIANSRTPMSKKDQKEFNLMSQEKLEAGTASAFAMAAYMTRLNHKLWTRAFEQMLGVNTAMISLAASGTISQSASRQKTLGRAVAQSMDTGSRLSSTTANLLQRGLEPVHAKATANARRLLR